LSIYKKSVVKAHHDKKKVAFGKALKQDRGLAFSLSRLFWERGMDFRKHFSVSDTLRDPRLYHSGKRSRVRSALAARKEALEIPDLTIHRGTEAVSPTIPPSRGKRHSRFPSLLIYPSPTLPISSGLQLLQLL
jgi:hypothetical protein